MEHQEIVDKYGSAFLMDFYSMVAEETSLSDYELDDKGFPIPNEEAIKKTKIKRAVRNLLINS